MRNLYQEISGDVAVMTTVGVPFSKRYFVAKANYRECRQEELFVANEDLLELCANVDGIWQQALYVAHVTLSWCL